MPNLLLVEDCSELATAITAVLQKHHTISVAPNLTSAKKLITEKSYNLLLLDVSLPDGNGFELYQWVRENHVDRKVPIIFLTGEIDLPSRLKGLELGAHDYITKPFYSAELIQRVANHLKNSEASTTTLYQYGDLKFDWQQQKVFLVHNKQETLLNLTPNEYKILSFLSTSPNTEKTREEIINSVWGNGFSLSHKVINTHICNLRRKMLTTTCKIIAGEQGYSLSA